MKFNRKKINSITISHGSKVTDSPSVKRALCSTVNYKEDIMQVTKNIVKFSNMLIKIPKAMKGVWDKSENRWGYKRSK